jgi:hypothetical protein
LEFLKNNLTEKDMPVLILKNGHQALIEIIRLVMALTGHNNRLGP